MKRLYEIFVTILVTIDTALDMFIATIAILFLAIRDGYSDIKWQINDSIASANYIIDHIKKEKKWN